MKDIKSISTDKFVPAGKALDLIYNFIVFDGGMKKICRHNQYFGVLASRQRIIDGEGGIVWHTQGSGKSLHDGVAFTLDKRKL
jgi:type I site-specific restriction-modification system R (restriction) subunit